MRHPRLLVLDRDPKLAAQVHGVADELHPRPEVVVCQRLGQVGDVLTDEGPFDVLVAGPAMGTRTGITRLRVIHDELPAMAIVLAFDRRPDASLRDIVRAGAEDLLQLPVSDEDLVRSLERAIAAATRAAPPTAAPPARTNGQVVHAAVTAPTGPAPVLTVASATGGCGKTFFATNLAYHLAHHTGRRACVVDLDLQFGEVSTALRLRPSYTIVDALEREDGLDEAELAAHVEECLVRHETGIEVLAAPRDPSDADGIAPADVARVLEALRSRVDYVIVDTPPAMTEVVLAALDVSTRLFVMATLDLPSVRNLGLFLGTLEKLHVPTEHVGLIMNKAESDVGMEMAQVARLFPQGFDGVLPYAKEVSRSINLGMPVLAAAPDAEISRVLHSILTPVLPPEVQAAMAAVAPARPAGALQRLLGRFVPASA